MLMWLLKNRCCTTCLICLGFLCTTQACQFSIFGVMTAKKISSYKNNTKIVPYFNYIVCREGNNISSFDSNKNPSLPVLNAAEKWRRRQWRVSASRSNKNMCASNKKSISNKNKSAHVRETGKNKLFCAVKKY